MSTIPETKIKYTTHYEPSTKNQDVHFVWESSTNNMNIYTVIDGHGIHGQEFAEKIKEKFSKKFSTINTTESIGEQIKSIFESTNDELYSLKYKSSGAAVSVVVELDDKIIVANVGDCDVYLFDENHNLTNLNESHNFVLEKEARRIDLECKEKGIIYSIFYAVNSAFCTEKEVWDKDFNIQPLGPGHFYKNRMFEPAIYIQQKQIFGYSPMLNMSRSIGDYDLKKLGVSATPFTAEYPKKENSILLVGSDGFWDSWTTKELCAELGDLENYKNIHEKSIKMNKFYFKDDADDNTLIMVFF